MPLLVALIGTCMAGIGFLIYKFPNTANEVLDGTIKTTIVIAFGFICFQVGVMLVLSKKITDNSELIQPSVFFYFAGMLLFMLISISLAKWLTKKMKDEKDKSVN